MPTRAEALYTKLQSREAIGALIGTAEDTDFDCSLWSQHASAKHSIAKSACGFTNATGGVIVIGVNARRDVKEDVDVVTELKPVADMEAVKSEVLDAILKYVHPGIEGVQTHLVADSTGSRSGYVLVFIPESDGSPRWSRENSKFYVRIASGTVPMEYFQIEDRFGRRPRPKMEITIGDQGAQLTTMGSTIERIFVLSVTNEGRGLARFPALRLLKVPQVVFQPAPYSSAPAWPIHYTLPDWVSYRAGAENVLYPGETIEIGVVRQVGKKSVGGNLVIPNKPANMLAEAYDWAFAEVTLTAEVMADEMRPRTRTFVFEALYVRGQ
jgi:hypothetical protein